MRIYRVVQLRPLSIMCDSQSETIYVLYCGPSYKHALKVYSRNKIDDFDVGGVGKRGRTWVQSRECATPEAEDAYYEAADLQALLGDM